MTLPPLPDDPEGSMEVDLGPNWHNGQIAPGRVVGYLDAYSAKQMHEYATAAVLAEREACALLCEPVAVERQDIGGPARTFWEQPQNCAGRIRARNEE